MKVFDLSVLSDELGIEVVTKGYNKFYCLSDFTGDVSFGCYGDDFYFGVCFGGDPEKDSVFGIKWSKGLYAEYNKAVGDDLSDDEIDEAGLLFESEWADEIYKKFTKFVINELRA